MAISKVYLNNDVQMDVTDTTASQSDVASTKYYYGADGIKKQGSYVVPSAVTQATPTISVNTSTGLITASATQSAGVVSAGTTTATEQLTTQAAQTLYPSTTDQTIASGKYLTGTQTVKGVLLTNLTAGNIKKDVVVKVGDSADDDRITSVTGTYEGSGGGGTEAEEKDVNFIDYDGTIVYSYTKTEFAQLAALPANPSHTGLTAQGWNWSLSAAKAYVAKYGKLWIGQMYVTSDGKTEIDIELDEGRLSPYLGLAVNGEVDIDWGDGSTHSTITGTSTTSQVQTLHNYANAGKYTIKISVLSGSFAFYSSSNTYSVMSANSATGSMNRVYAAAVQAIRIGTNVDIKNYAFAYCRCLETITISDGVLLGNPSSFVYAGLRGFVYPSGITTIGNSQFQYCYNLRAVALPSSLTALSSALSSNSIRKVTIPEVSSITNLANCDCISSLVIPETVTSLAAAFQNMYGLGEIHFKPTEPPATSSSSAFSNVPTDCIIYVPYSADHSILNAYKAATNYPSSSTYTYMEE